MFGRRRDLAALQFQVETLERRIRRLEEENAAARSLLKDVRQLEDLTERIATLRKDAESAAKNTNTPTLASGTNRGPSSRFRPRLNVVYQAETAGYVSLYFAGGYTDQIRILVGPEKPPAECVCEANSTNEFNSYAGAIVQAGEYWTAESKRGGGSGVRCVFTPLR